MHRIAAALGLPGVALAALVAQADANTPTTILGAFILLAVTMAGTVTWMVKQLVETNRKNTESFAQALSEIENAHSLRYKAMAEAHQTAVRELIRDHKEEMNEEREFRDRSHAEILSGLQRNHETGRENVHLVRNLAATVSLRNRLADAFQSAEVAAWTKSLDGTLLSWNGAAERLLGWKAGEVVGKSVYGTVIPPERHDEERGVLHRIAQGETVQEYRTERLARDGRRVALYVVTSPIRDPSGKVTGASTIAHEA